jgi:hypothetical protein
MTTHLRQEGDDKPKPLTRHALEAAAQRHGVPVHPDMTNRSVMEAVVRKLQPDAKHYTFAGRDTDTYAEVVFETALAEAEKAAAAKAPPPAVTQAAPPTYVNGSGAPRADAAAPVVLRQDARRQLVSADAARDKMIRDMVLGIGGIGQ